MISLTRYINESAQNLIDNFKEGLIELVRILSMEAALEEWGLDEDIAEEGTEEYCEYKIVSCLELLNFINEKEHNKDDIEELALNINIDESDVNEYLLKIFEDTKKDILRYLNECPSIYTKHKEEFEDAVSWYGLIIPDWVKRGGDIGLTMHKLSEGKTVDVTEMGDEIHSKVAEIINDNVEKIITSVYKIVHDLKFSVNKDAGLKFIDDILKLRFIDNELNLKHTDEDTDTNYDINALINSYPEQEEDTVIWLVELAIEDIRNEARLEILHQIEEDKEMAVKYYYLFDEFKIDTEFLPGWLKRGTDIGLLGMNKLSESFGMLDDDDSDNWIQNDIYDDLKELARKKTDKIIDKCNGHVFVKSVTIKAVEQYNGLDCPFIKNLLDIRCINLWEFQYNEVFEMEADMIEIANKYITDYFSLDDVSDLIDIAIKKIRSEREQEILQYIEEEQSLFTQWKDLMIALQIDISFLPKYLLRSDDSGLLGLVHEGLKSWLNIRFLNKKNIDKLSDIDLFSAYNHHKWASRSGGVDEEKVYMIVKELTKRKLLTLDKNKFKEVASDLGNINMPKVAISELVSEGDYDAMNYYIDKGLEIDKDFIEQYMIRYKKYKGADITNVAIKTSNIKYLPPNTVDFLLGLDESYINIIKDYMTDASKEKYKDLYRGTDLDLWSLKMESFNDKDEFLIGLNKDDLAILKDIDPNYKKDPILKNLQKVNSKTYILSISKNDLKKDIKAYANGKYKDIYEPDSMYKKSKFLKEEYLLICVLFTNDVANREFEFEEYVESNYTHEIVCLLEEIGQDYRVGIFREFMERIIKEIGRELLEEVYEGLCKKIDEYGYEVYDKIINGDELDGTSIEEYFSIFYDRLIPKYKHLERTGDLGLWNLKQEGLTDWFKKKPTVWDEAFKKSNLNFTNKKFDFKTLTRYNGKNVYNYSLYKHLKNKTKEDVKNIFEGNWKWVVKKLLIDKSLIYQAKFLITALKTNVLYNEGGIAPSDLYEFPHWPTYFNYFDDILSDFFSDRFNELTAKEPSVMKMVVDKEPSDIFARYKQRILDEHKGLVRDNSVGLWDMRQESLSDVLLGAIGKKRKSNVWYSTWEKVKEKYDQLSQIVYKRATGTYSKDELYAANDYIYDTIKNKSKEEVKKEIAQSWTWMFIKKDGTIEYESLFLEVIYDYLYLSDMPHDLKKDTINQRMNKNIKHKRKVIGNGEYEGIITDYFGDIIDEIYVEKFTEIIENEPANLSFVIEVLDYKTNHDDRNFSNVKTKLVKKFPALVRSDSVGLWDMKQEKFSEYIKNK